MRWKSDPDFRGVRIDGLREQDARGTLADETRLLTVIIKFVD